MNKKWLIALLTVLFSLPVIATATGRPPAQRSNGQEMLKALTGDPQEVRKRAAAMQWARAMAHKAAMLKACDDHSVEKARREVEIFLSTHLPSALAPSLTAFDQISDSLARVPQRLVAPDQCGRLEQQPGVQRTVQAIIDRSARSKNALMQQLGMSDDRCSPLARWASKLVQ